MLGVMTLALTLLPAAAPAAPSPPPNTIAERRSDVRAGERRVADLASRLERQLGQLRSLEDVTSETSVRLGVARLRLDALEAEAADARSLLNARAREAYKRGAWRHLQALFGLESVPQVLSFSRFLGGQMREDQAAYRDLIETREALQQERRSIDEQKQVLLGAHGRIDRVRKSIQALLDAEQAAVASAQAELTRMEAARRAEEARRRRVSPEVEARRTERQRVLDERLAALLAWYAPGIGSEPFLPKLLKSTGLVTTGASSWYGPGFDGRRASSGATYRQTQLTAASLVLPFGTFLKVTLGGRSVVVVITDRGPYVAGRVLDLSAAAGEAIGLSGVRDVRMEILVPREPGPPFP